MARTRYWGGTKTGNAEGAVGINIVEYGLVGDGVTDNSTAMMDLWEEINGYGGDVVLICPQGTYRYQWTHGTPNNRRRLENIDGLFVRGEGAIFKPLDNAKNGRFDPGNVNKNEAWLFWLYQCQNVEFSGIIFNGNKPNLDYGDTQVDGSGIGWYIQGCSDIGVKNCRSDLAGRSGMLIAQIDDNNRNHRITVENYYSDLCRHSGININGLSQGQFTNCFVSNVGQSAGGLYPGSGTQAGIIAAESVISPDMRNWDIEFKNCHSEGNKFSAFHIDEPDWARDIRIIGGVYTGVESYSIWGKNPTLYIKGATFRGETFRLQGVATETTFYNDDSYYGGNEGVALGSNIDAPFVARDCTIEVDGSRKLLEVKASTTEENAKTLDNIQCIINGNGLGDVNAECGTIGGKAYVNDLRLIHRGTGPTSGYYFINATGDGTIVRNSYSDDGAKTRIRVDGPGVGSSTDLTRSIFATGQHEMTDPHGDSRGFLGSVIQVLTAWDDFTKEARNYSGDAVPATGTWNQGDFVRNTAPTKDVNNLVLFGWVCTAGGSPGTWEPLYFKTTSP